MGTFSRNGSKVISLCWLKILGALVFAAAAGTARATPPISTDSPLGFFTNVAARVLLTQMDVDINHIEVYPTNQYTPAVHRLLQVTANIYEATTTNYYPSVFRPIFTSDGAGNVFITGYTNVVPMTNPTDDPQFSLPMDASMVRGVNVVTNVYGVPWIIGAKKGFPNFNAFTMENVFKITRTLQLTRPNTSVNYITSPSSYIISQQLTLGLANSLDVECWNSYRADYTNAQPMEIFAAVQSTAALTNDEGMNYVLGSYYANAITTPDWKGYGNYTIPQPTSFLYPLYLTNAVVLPDSIYTFNPTNPLVPYSPAYFVANTLIPHWTLLLTNRVRVAMVEHNPVDNLWHVIDYVQLAGPGSSRDLSADIQSLYDTKVNSGYDDMWDTNRDVRGVLIGMDNQLGVSTGVVAPILTPYWAQQDPTWVTNQIALFSAFLGFNPLFPLPPSAQPYVQMGESTLTQQAPYTPTATVVYETQWEANDPLVHYLASDLTDLNRSTAAMMRVNPLVVGQLNDCYMPWGGNPQFSGKDLNPYNLALKDPLVSSSDAWNFPTNRPLNADWLGQIHRGTPWQTIDLKATNILSSTGGLNTWIHWTGDTNPTDAAEMTPIQDWHLASLLAAMFNTNDFRSLFSVNNPKPAAWQSLFDGLIAITNTAPGQFEAVAVASNSPQASIMAGAIQTVRDLQQNELFLDAGDVLATPQLSTASPFLNAAPANSVSDEAYEAIPAQLLSLIRADSIGSISPDNTNRIVQFTGYDGHDYVIQTSANLVDWINISTNSPSGGVLNFTNAQPPAASVQFYRSVLLN